MITLREKPSANSKRKNIRNPRYPRIGTNCLKRDTHKEDKKNGEYQYSYENGQLAKKEKYEMGVENGMFYDYSPSGSLTREREYNDGVLDGIYREYAIAAEGSTWETTYVYGQYANNELVGYWEWGDFDGNWTAKREYSNGVMIYFQNRKEIIYYNTY